MPEQVTPVAEYDATTIETKWQARWDKSGTNHSDVVFGSRPYYALMMFPYPSAEGLHVGNLFAFTGNDIHGRFQRMQRYSVFEPMGFDAFGIHSENFALKVGINPMELIPKNKGFEEWGEIFGDDMMAAALIDRLVHHCHIVNIRGNSYRMRHHADLRSPLHPRPSVQDRTPHKRRTTRPEAPAT